MLRWSAGHGSSRSTLGEEFHSDRYELCVDVCIWNFRAGNHHHEIIFPALLGSGLADEES